MSEFILLDGTNEKVFLGKHSSILKSDRCGFLAVASEATGAAVKHFITF